MCDAALNALLDDIIRLASPETVILFSHKQNPAGALTAVKLCIIIENGDAAHVEHDLYVALDSPLPFDVLVYRREEWERLLTDTLSFASRIRDTGSVLYEK